VSAGAEGALEAVLRQVAERRRLEAALRETLLRHGYLEVEVPLLQPAEADGDWGASYRVLDQDGALLELRPDVTLPVARLCAAGDRGGPRPRRLSYLATLFRRGPDGPREILQAGAERIGAGPDEGPGREAADAEVLALCAACLEAAGFAEYLLVVGHAGYVRELLAGHPRADAVQEALRVRDRCAARALGASADLLWRGTLCEAEGALRRTGPAGREFVGFLDLLAGRGFADRVLVEPGLLLPGRYYTGFVFEVLLPGEPWPVGDGGRYDGLLARWGPDEPAVGFALDCGALLAARRRSAGRTRG
jgi:ATP phosphoribosyltransferase regulatory subunit